MPTLLSTLIAAATPATTAASKSKGGSTLPSLLFLVVILAAGYFLFLRPRQAKARQAQARGSQLAVGDEVVSIGGIKGRIVGIDDQDVQVEVSPGVVMTFLRRAVNPPTPPTPLRGGRRPNTAGGSPPTDTSVDDQPEEPDEHQPGGTAEGPAEDR